MASPGEFYPSFLPFLNSPVELTRFPLFYEWDIQYVTSPLPVGKGIILGEPNLNWTAAWESVEFDHDPYMYLYYIFLAVFFTLLNVFSAIVAPELSSTYRTASLQIQRTWNNKFVSTIHALIAVFGVLWCIFIADADGWLLHDSTTRSLLSFELVLGVTIGYLLYDTVDTIRISNPDWKMSVAHHITALIAFIMASQLHRGVYYCIFMVIFEGTTPFINARWFLSTIGWKDTKLYIYNGLIILIGWVVIRLYPNFWMLWETWTRFYLSQNAPFILLAPFLLTMITMTLINIYWFVKLVSGAAAVLRERKAQKPQQAPKPTQKTTSTKKQN